MRIIGNLALCALLLACAPVAEFYDSRNDAYSMFRNEDLKYNCAQGSGMACTRMGYRYESGDGVQKVDPNAAYPYFAQGCNAGVARACGAIGHYYAYGIVVAQDLPNAAALLKFACQDGDPNSCNDLGYVSQQMGQSNAKQYYDRACTLNSADCKKQTQI